MGGAGSASGGVLFFVLFSLVVFLFMLSFLRLLPPPPLCTPVLICPRFFGPSSWFSRIGGPLLHIRGTIESQCSWQGAHEVSHIVAPLL